MRRVVGGQGVERIFPLHSPKVAGVEVIRGGKVRRAKLYLLRDRIGKATRLKEVKRNTGAKKKAKKAKKVEPDVEAKAEVEAEAVAESEQSEE